MTFRKRKELSGHSSAIYSLAFDQTFIYTASADKFVARWNAETGIQDKFAIRFESPVYSLCLLDNDKKLAVGLANGDLHVFDLDSKQELKFFKQHPSALFALIENPVQGQLYAGDADGNLSVWSVDTNELLLILPLMCGKIRRIAISPSGDFIALACQDGTYRVFDTQTFNEIETVQAHKGGTTALLFDPNDESILYTGGKDAWLRSWKWKNGSIVNEVPAHNYVIYDIICLNSRKTLITASRDKTVKVWNKERLSFLQRLDQKGGGHRHSVNCLIVYTDNSFVTASDDKRIILFEKLDDA
jgi:WD40 repeat protein